MAYLTEYEKEELTEEITEQCINTLSPKNKDKKKWKRPVFSTVSRMQMLGFVEFKDKDGNIKGYCCALA